MRDMLKSIILIVCQCVNIILIIFVLILMILHGYVDGARLKKIQDKVQGVYRVETSDAYNQ